MPGRSATSSSPANLSWNRLELEAGGEWRPPTDSWSFIHLEVGSGYWLSSEKSRMLEPGNILLSHPGGNVLRASTLRKVCLHHSSFRLNDIVQAADGFMADEVCRGLSLVEGCVLLLDNDGELARDIRRHSKTLLRTGAKQSTEHIVRWIASAVLPGRTFLTDRNVTRAPQQRRLNEWLRRFDIEALCTMTVAEMATKFGCSSRHLSRLFHREFGVSVRRQQIVWRIGIACRLLEDYRLRVVDVALGSGYRNLGLFNAAFKKMTGMTPSRWRRLSAISTSAEGNAKGLPEWPGAASATAAVGSKMGAQSEKSDSSNPPGRINSSNSFHPPCDVHSERSSECVRPRPVA